MSINKVNLKNGDLITEDKLAIIDDNFNQLNDNKTEVLSKLNYHDSLLSDVAHITYVDEQIAKAQLEGSGVDTSNFAMKSDIDNTNSTIDDVSDLLNNKMDNDKNELNSQIYSHTSNNDIHVSLSDKNNWDRNALTVNEHEEILSNHSDKILQNDDKLNQVTNLVDITLKGSNIVDENSNKLITDEGLVLSLDDFLSTEDVLDLHISNNDIHVRTSDKDLWNTVSNKVDKISGKSLSTNDFTDDFKSKLEGISFNAKKVETSTNNGNIKIDGIENVVYTHPRGTNPHGTTKSDLGLNNVDNTSDLEKPISNSTQIELNNVNSNILSHTNDKTVHVSLSDKNNWDSNALDLENVKNDIIYAKDKINNDYTTLIQMLNLIDILLSGTNIINENGDVLIADTDLSLSV